MNSDQSQFATRTIDEYLVQLPDRVVRTLRAWEKLSAAERKDLAEAVDRIRELSESEIKKVFSIVTNMPLKPFGDPCPYCGRS